MTDAVDSELPQAAKLGTAPEPGPVPIWRRALPFMLGGALVAYVVSRVDIPAFLHALSSTNYFLYAAFAFTFNAALLAADALATMVVYRRTVAPVRYSDVFVIRAASYLPSILSHHVGQAWLTYFLAKVYKAPIWRVAGATLLVYVTTFGALFVFLLVGLPLNREELTWLVPTVAVVGTAGAVYLGVVYLKPALLAGRQVTAPLAEVGIRGHLSSLLFRLPHVWVQFIGAWVPFLFFGVHIPLSDALALMPILMFVVALPISPQGLGTRDALSLALLSRYAVGSADEQAAAIAATTLSWLGVLTLVQLVLSPLFMRRAYRLLHGTENAR
jgi:hypothetical protein